MVESHDIFVSYSRENIEWVDKLVQALKASGYSVWWDDDLEPGQRFRPVIGSALDAAGCVIVVWSQHSIQSDWVPTEASQALTRNVLVPVSLESVKLPLPFGELQTIDLQGWQGDRREKRFKVLVKGIQSKLDTPPPLEIADDVAIEPKIEQPVPQKTHWWQSLWKSLLVLFTIAGGVVALMQLYLWSVEPPLTHIESPVNNAFKLEYKTEGPVHAGDKIDLLYQAKPEGFLSLWGQNPDGSVERLLPKEADKQALPLNQDRITGQIGITFKSQGEHQFLLLWTPPEKAQHLPKEYYPDNAMFSTALGALPNAQQAELKVLVQP